jgi:hypothetical protein
VGPISDHVQPIRATYPRQHRHSWHSIQRGVAHEPASIAPMREHYERDMAGTCAPLPDGIEAERPRSWRSPTIPWSVGSLPALVRRTWLRSNTLSLRQKTDFSSAADITSALIRSQGLMQRQSRKRQRSTVMARERCSAAGFVAPAHAVRLYSRGSMPRCSSVVAPARAARPHTMPVPLFFTTLHQP